MGELVVRHGYQTRLLYRLLCSLFINFLLHAELERKMCSLFHETFLPIRLSRLGTTHFAVILNYENLLLKNFTIAHNTSRSDFHTFHSFSLLPNF